MSTSETTNNQTALIENKPLKEELKTEPMDVDKPQEVRTGTDGTAPGGNVEKQKAIVKPHILTHFIEGFVIQESAEPFQVICCFNFTKFFNFRLILSWF